VVDVTGVNAGGTVCIMAQNILVARPVVAGDTAGLQANNNITFESTGNVTAGNLASLNAVAGAISGTGGVNPDITAQNVALNAGTNVGQVGATRIGINAEKVAADAQAGNIALTSLGSSGICVLTETLACGNGTVLTGLKATGNIDLTATQGDIQLTTVDSGGASTIIANVGSILDKSGHQDVNVTAHGGSTIEACNGTVGTVNDPIKVHNVGNLTVGGHDITLTGVVTGDIIIMCSPDISKAGTFNGDRLTQMKNVTSEGGTRVILINNNTLAADNINMGVHSFYLDTLNDLILLDTPDPLSSNIDTVDQLNDLQFLLRKSQENK
jgi:hypothetical protein